MTALPRDQAAAPGAGADQAASLDALFPAVYDELRRLAGRHLRGERPDHTLQPTALVHEAYMRLAEQHGAAWPSRAHFFGAAAAMMRRILVNHAHAHNAAKRGGGVTRVTLDESVSWAGERDEALTALAAQDPRQGRVVALRVFAGLSVEATAEVLGVSPATVKREWSVAKAWLRRELTRGPE